MTTLVPLNNIAYRRLEMHSNISYSHTEKIHMMPAFVSEFIPACGENR